MSFSIGSVFSAFLNSGDPMEAVQAAQYQLEAKVGKFLTTGQLVSDSKTHADALRSSSNPIVVDKATALSSLASALLTEYGNIKQDATNLINTAIDLKNRIIQDPSKFTDGESTTAFGWRVMDILSQNKNAVLQVSSDSVSMTRRIDSYMDKVDTLQGDVTNLIAFSQGKGVSAALSSFGSAYTSVAKVGVGVGVAALATYLLAPSFFMKLKRSMRS